MAIPTFNKLWASYPDRKSMEKRCFNKQKTWQKLFDNYCAISLSESFIRSGILVSHAPGNKCWSHSGARHLLLAEDFAKWLKTSPPPGFGKMEEIPPQNFQSLLKGRTGVIFFKDYYQRGSQKFANRTGDHIDLWNKNKIISSSMWWRSVIEFFNIVSDLNASKKIWFWEVK